MVENERKRTERLLAEEDAEMRSMSAMHAKTEKQHKEEQRLKDVKISSLMDIFLSKLDFMQKLEKEKGKKETRIKLTDHDKANMQMLLEAIDKDFFSQALESVSTTIRTRQGITHLVALQFFNQHLGKDHVCQRNLSQTKLVSTQEKKMGLGKEDDSVRKFIQKF